MCQRQAIGLRDCKKGLASLVGLQASPSAMAHLVAAERDDTSILV
jgi:hypothetical protein